MQRHIYIYIHTYIYLCIRVQHEPINRECWLCRRHRHARKARRHAATVEVGHRGLNRFELQSLGGRKGDPKRGNTNNKKKRGSFT